MTDPAPFPPQASMVRRVDVTLRAMYPHLVTRIFEVASHEYQIVFDKSLLDATEEQNHFQQRVKPASISIDLANDVPLNFLHEIPPINDQELSIGLEGYPFTIADIENLLLSQYPDLPRITKSANQINPITLLFEGPLTTAQEEKVRAFMAGNLPDWPVAISVAASDEANPQTSNTRASEVEIEVRPSCLRPHAPPFVREDEAFWFENIDALFQGRLRPNTFAGTADAGTTCYLGGPSFPQIDLRQAVLLYDTVYLSPPIVEASATQADFWQQQEVTREDVLQLIELDRVRLVLVQPEERTDPAFLSAAYERNPCAIIGRRTAAAMMISDIVATADEYVLSSPDLKPVVYQLASRIAEETGASSTTISRLLLWPEHARRSCLSPLMTRGLMGLASFSQGGIFAEQIRAATGRDVELEALITSDSVHIAHFLNATLIPPTQEMRGWIEPRRLVGDRLNFYRSFNSRIAAAWAVNERRKEKRVRILPPVPLFNFHPRSTIKELIDLTSLGSTRRKGRAMMTRLAELLPEERAAEIEQLSQELYDLGGRQSRRSFWLDNVSDAADIGAAAIDMSLWPLRPMWNFLDRALNLARQAPALDNFIGSIEQELNDKFGHNSDLDFLSKISRIAELRDNTK